MLNLSGLYFAYFDCWSQVISDYQIKQPILRQNPFEPYTFTQTEGQLDSTVMIIVSNAYLTLELFPGFFPR